LGLTSKYDYTATGPDTTGLFVLNYAGDSYFYIWKGGE